MFEVRPLLNKSITGTEAVVTRANVGPGPMELFRRDQ